MTFLAAKLNTYLYLKKIFKKNLLKKKNYTQRNEGKVFGFCWFPIDCILNVDSDKNEFYFNYNFENKKKNLILTKWLMLGTCGC